MTPEKHGLEGTPLGDFIDTHGDDVVEVKEETNASGQKIITKIFRNGKTDITVDHLAENDDVADLYHREIPKQSLPLEQGQEHPEATSGQMDKMHKEAIKEDIVRTRKKVMDALYRKIHGRDRE
jgi:hypothetical protein